MNGPSCFNATGSGCLVAIAMLAAWPSAVRAQAAQARAGETYLEEIIITARRRAEGLEGTPISVTALTAQALEARFVTDVSQIGSLAPNLIFNTSSAISGSASSASVFIRGIGQTDFLLVNEPGVGIYLDGVYIARSLGSVIDLIDSVERIEVLRGPQGTLFGRNTIGGAISITSKAPTDEVRGQFGLTTGSYGRLDVTADISGPLTEDLFGSLTLARFGREGHIQRPFLADSGDDDGWAARSVLRWTPASDLEFNLSVDFTHRKDQECCEELIAINPGGFMPVFHNLFVAPFTGEPFATPGLVPGKAWVSHATKDVPSEITIYGVALNAEWQVSEHLTVKSITAFRKLDSDIGADADYSPIRLVETVDTYDAEQFSQELHLQGTAFDGRLNWITGLYYFDERGTNIDDIDFAAYHFISGGKAKNESFAVFGQASYDLTEKLTLTAGLRWTRDHKEFDPDTYMIENRTLGTPFELAIPSILHSDFAAGPAGLVPLMPGDLLIPPGVTGDATFKETVPYLNLAYQWTPELMTYLSYSEGYKGGGFVQRIFPDFPVVPSFDPEFVEVYEAGFKYFGANNRLRLSGAVFHTDYTDLQVVVFESGIPITRNAAGAEIDGFELEAEAALTGGLRLNLGIGYLDAEYTDIDPGVITDNLSLDSQLVNAPKWSVSAGVAYTVNLPGLGTLTPRIDWSHRSRTYTDARNTPELVQDAYGLLNLSLTFEDASGRWLVQLFGSNVTDKRYVTGGVGGPDFQGVITGAFGRPAEWGLTVKRRF